MDKPFFYTKIDMDMLNSIADEEIDIKELKNDGDTYFKLLKPYKKYSLNLSLKKYDINIINEIGFNPKYIFFINDRLWSGSLVEFKDKEGLWDIITHCSSCFRSFLGYPRVVNYTEKDGCETPNCAANLKFRNRMIANERYLGEPE